MDTLTRTEELPGLKQMREDLAKIEEKVVLGYTLADAIREGSQYTDQKVGGFVDVDKNQTCALSAAALAVEARYGS